MKLRVPRIPIVSTLAFLLLVTVVVLWARSERHADVLAFYTPEGHLDGLASDRAGMLLCTSDIPFGREMGLSADGMSTSAEEFAAIHDLLFDPANEKWHFLGFRTAAGTLGTWGWKFHAILVPYWALVIPLAALPLTGFRRVAIRVRRKRRGQCLACGYDLRHTPDRCPECGRPVGDSARGSAAVASGGRPTITVAGILSWLVLGALIATAASAVVRGRRVAAAAGFAPPEAALLNRPLRQVDLDGVALDRGIDMLARDARTRVVIDRPSFDPQLVISSSPCAIHLRDVRLATALSLAGTFPRLIGQNPWANSAEETQVWASGGSVHVGLSSSAPLVVRAYPVGDLLRQIQADLRREEDESQIAPASPPYKGGAGNTIFTGGGRASFQAPPAREALTDIVMGQVRPDEWVDNGGKLGALTIVANRIWVCQTQEGHAAVRALLALLESTPPAADAVTPAPPENAHANLEQKISELKLESTNLEGAIEGLRQATEANIVVYWDDLEVAGVHRGAPIKLHLWDVTLDRALGAILSLAGGDHPAMRAVQDGVIVVATPERIRNGSASIRIYDVRDLVEKYLAEGRLAHPTTAPATVVVNDAPFPGTYEEVLESITRLIEDEVDTDTWKDNGGSIGSLRQLGGRLIVTQTPAAHRQIAALLRTLRTGGSKEGTPLCVR